jgi:hypothetical protein
MPLQVSLLDKDLVLVPIHLDVHWSLAVLDLRHGAVRYYDSLHTALPPFNEVRVVGLGPTAHVRFRVHFDAHAARACTLMRAWSATLAAGLSHVWFRVCVTCSCLSRGSGTKRTTASGSAG